MDLQQMFMNSLYMLGIVIVAIIIAELILSQYKKALALRVFKKAVEKGDVHVSRVYKSNNLEDEETDFK